MAQRVKGPPVMQGDLGLIPGLGRSPGEGNGTHASMPGWRIPRGEEPGGLQSPGSQSQTRPRDSHTHLHKAPRTERGALSTALQGAQTEVLRWCADESGACSRAGRPCGGQAGLQGFTVRPHARRGLVGLPRPCAAPLAAPQRHLVSFPEERLSPPQAGLHPTMKPAGTPGPPPPLSPGRRHE